jgi:quinol monooxygenase YgiN
MLIVHVHITVKHEHIERFREATLRNAQSSLEEPGVVRFDVVEERDHPERFVLVEVYRHQSDAARHKETAHYLAWRDTVAAMMAEPRRSVSYVEIFPAGESAWVSQG